MLPSLRALALAALLVALAAPASASAQLDLSLVSSSGTETVGNDDDVVGPGDRFRVATTIGTAGPLNGANGTLYTATPGVTMLSATSPFPNAPAGGRSSNTTPFEALLAADSPCGANVDFALNVTDGGGAEDVVTFRVPTGTRGTVVGVGTGPAATLADNAVTDVAMSVAQAGRVKRVEVRIGSLTHPQLSDLRLELVAPDGTTTLLAEAGTLLGADLIDTVFADDGDALAFAVPHYSDRYAPAGSLDALEGRVLNGTWTLKVTDTVAGDQGTLDAWGLRAARAFCSGIPKAAYTATPPRANPGETVTFDAATSFDTGGGTIDLYEWDLDGDGEYDDHTGQQVQRSFPRGSHRIGLRVTDNDGLTDVEVRNLPVSLPPVAAVTATPTNPLSDDTFRLDAAGSADTDPDGTIVRYQWDVDGDGAYERDSEGTSYIDASLPTPGTVTARVLVTDEDGAQDSESVQLTVRNRPPEAAIADPVLPLRGRPVVLSAAGSSDPDGSVTLYEWDLDGDGGFDTAPAVQPTISHTFATAGVKTVGVRVTDNRDATATTTRQFTVTNAPVAVVSATPNPASFGEQVGFDASGSSDPDAPGAALTYAWDLDGDQVDDFDDATGPAAARSWPTAGTRLVKVRVTDPSGAQTVGSVNVVVRNMPPVGALSANPAAPKVREVTALTAVGSTDGDGTIVRYQWDLDGDGAFEQDTGATPSTSTTFANPGNVTVAVRLTDDDGGTGTKALTIGVVRPPDAPPPTEVTPVQPATIPVTTPGTPPGGTTRPALPGGDPADDGSDPRDPRRPLAAWLGGAARQRTAYVLARGVLLSCRSEVATACALRVKVSARDARRLRLGRTAVVVARGSISAPAGRTVRRRLKLTAKARRALRGANGLRLLVGAVVRAQDGREVALQRVVLLRR